MQCKSQSQSHSTVVRPYVELGKSQDEITASSLSLYLMPFYSRPIVITN